jgi:hypothetical protein
MPELPPVMTACDFFSPEGADGIRKYTTWDKTHKNPRATSVMG